MQNVKLAMHCSKKVSSPGAVRLTVDFPCSIKRQ